VLKNKNSWRQGFGTFEYDNGVIYEGLWQDDMPNGRGTFRFNTGDVYQGEITNDQAQGFGIYSSSNGAIYVGYYDQDVWHGFGHQKWNNGDRFCGFRSHALKNGQGEFCWDDGDKYIGTYDKDMRVGRGFFVYQNGDLYQGMYKEDIQDGEGTLKYVAENNDKQIYHGERKYKHANGKGMQLWTNGDAYIGEWQYDKMHGKGYWITIDTKNPYGLKFAKAEFANGELQDLNYQLTNEEISEQLKKYKELEDRKLSIHLDLDQAQHTSNQLAFEYLLISAGKSDKSPLADKMLEALKFDKDQFLIAVRK